MALTAVSNKDIFKRLNRAGISGAIQATQILQAAKLFIASELPELTDSIEPLYLRETTLVVRCHNSVAAQLLKQQQQELLEYINQVSGIGITQLYFRV